MNIGLLPVGSIDSTIIDRIGERLQTVFADAKFTVIAEPMSIPCEAFNATRQQYRSDSILGMIRNYAEKAGDFDQVLGIMDVDIYVPRLNFVFGQAESPGKAALISLWRLKPEFYGNKPNPEAFLERSAKEAVHELGHTLGLVHCVNPFCVMYFSNSIFETDRKKSFFCNKCYLKIKVCDDRARR